jgi:hypothetical protein
MQLDSQRANVVFRKVLQVREHLKAYCLGHDRPDLSVEDLHRTIESMYDIKIEKYQVPFEGKFLSGLTERINGGAKIYIKKNSEDDSKRFAAIKELCHVLIDEKEDWSSDGVRTISTLLVEYVVNDNDTSTAFSQSEVFAEIAALEVSYPYADRVKDRELVAAGTLTTVRAAGIYRLPEFFIDRALSDWYHELSTSIWNEISK